MSTKDMRALNHWWHMLAELREETGRAVSAGEVAKHAGTARNTAKRWLEKMVAAGGARSYREYAKNGTLKTCYYPAIKD